MNRRAHYDKRIEFLKRVQNGLIDLLNDANESLTFEQRERIGIEVLNIYKRIDYINQRKNRLVQ